jgi:hypothetical protein
MVETFLDRSGPCPEHYNEVEVQSSSTHATDQVFCDGQGIVD